MKADCHSTGCNNAQAFLAELAHIYQNEGGMELTAYGRKAWGRAAVFFSLLFLAGVILLERNLSQTMLDMAFAEAYSTAVETLNRAVKQVTEDEVEYAELVDVKLDAEGHVTMLRADAMRMNELAAKTALTAETELNSAENQIVRIPLGAALGVKSMSGFGPKMSMQILPVGSVHASFDTEFESAGINQTRHRIFLTLRATVSLIIPTGSQLVEVESKIPIAESIIVGAVPDSFVDVNDQKDILDLAP